jgi:methyl-accepting chemotaxis protein
MFKSLTLGRRVAGGYVVVLLLTVVIGVLSFVKVRQVQVGATALDQQTVPAMNHAANIERAILRAMWSSMNYSLTGNPEQLKLGRTNLAEAEKSLGECDTLAGTQGLPELTDAVRSVRSSLGTYTARIDDTEKSLNALAELRSSMAVAGNELTDLLQKYLDNMSKSMRDEITASAGAEKLNERLLKIEQGFNFGTMINATRRLNFQAQAQRNPEILQQAIAQTGEMQKKIAEIRLITRQKVNQDLLDLISANLEKYGTGLKAMLDISRQDQELAKARLAAASAAQQVAQQTTDNGMGDTRETAHQSAAAMASTSRTVLVGITVVTVLGSLLAFVICRSILKPMTRITRSLSDGAKQTASAAAQVSSAAQNLAQGASEQAASLEETSSSLEEMNSMTSRNAETASKASDVSGTAQSSARTGNDAMVRMTGAINEIEKSASETAKIIKAIDEIAFQTNLLALNAAVEAARAGDAGKGFAVVADEVRNLAMRSAEAARNTQTMIEESMHKARQGVQIADEVGKSLQEIVTAATSVNQFVGEISSSSTEQAKGIGQVTTAVSQMDKITQTNAASAEQSAAAAEELSSQSEQLRTIVNELSTMVGIR